MTPRLFFAPLILKFDCCHCSCAWMRYFAATRPITLLRELLLHAAFASIACCMLICADDARVTCRVVFVTRR